MNKNIILEDTTLRDGEQAPGVAFTKDAKIEIYRALVDIGVKWIEVGVPAIGGVELESVKTINEMAHSEGIIASASAMLLMSLPVLIIFPVANNAEMMLVFLVLLLSLHAAMGAFSWFVMKRGNDDA
mgnify:CR=1 FL=1